MKRTPYVLLVCLQWVCLLLGSPAPFVYADSGYEGSTTPLNLKYKEIAETMKTLYDKGDLPAVITLYRAQCTEGGNAPPHKEKNEFKRVNNDIRIAIYQWLVLSRIAMDMTDEGDIYLRRLLTAGRGKHIDGYWMPIRNAALKNYYIAPRLLVGFVGGANFSEVVPYKRFSILRSADVTYSCDKDYQSVFNSQGLQMGIIVEYALTQNFSVSFQPILRNIRFLYENNFIWKNEYDIESITAAKFTHLQQITYIELPILFKLQAVMWTLKPYIQAGAYYSILESAHKTLRSELVLGIDEFNEVAAMDMRNKFTWGNGGIIAGVGVGYDTGGIRLAVELNYKWVFNNIVNGNRRFEYNELIFNYYDVLDDLRLRNWDVSLKILLPITFKAFRR